MRSLLMALCMLVSGCASQGVYRVTYQGGKGAYTAYAINPRTLLSLSHDPVEKGERVVVETTRGPVPGVIRRNWGEIVVIGTAERVQPGDSGAAIIRDRDGAIVGFVWSRPIMHPVMKEECSHGQ